jgi:hypothetical protein
MKEPIALYSCSQCCEDYSHEAECLRIFEGKLWCEDCFYAEYESDNNNWYELERFVPRLQREIVELKKLVEQMAEALLALRKYPNTYKQTGQGNAVVDDDLILCDAALDAAKGAKE